MPIMKKTFYLTASLLIAFTGLTVAAGAAKPAPAKPVAKKAAAKPAAKKPIDPKVLAEKARYEGVSTSKFDAMRALDKEYPKCVDAWVELRDTMADGARLDMVWGYRARRDAEKRKLSLASDIAKLKRDFDKELEKADKRVNRDFAKIRKVVDKMAERPTSSSEKLNAVQAAELKKARDQMDLYEDMIFALSDMTRALGQTDSAKSSADRLTQIGATHGHGQGLSADQQKQYAKIIEITYLVKDYLADIAVFEARKAEGKEWQSNDEQTLKALHSRLEQTGAKLVQYVARENDKLKREVDKLKRDIERYEKQLESMSEGSSYDRYQEKKWELETELVQFENTVQILTHFADWKPKPAQKGAAKPAPKKKAGH
jgi:hypothetical protein